MSLNVASDENTVNPNEGAQKVKERNIGSVLNRRRRYLQEQKQNQEESLENQENTTFHNTTSVSGATKKGWQDEEEAPVSTATNKEQKGGRRLLGIFGGKNNNNNNEKPQQTDNSYIFQNVPRPLDGDEEVNAIESIPSLDQRIPALDQTIAEAPEEYASQKVQTLQELDQTTKATLHHFLNMKYDDRGLDLSLLTGALSYPLDELEQDEDWGNPQFVRDLLNSIKVSRNAKSNQKAEKNLAGSI
ncbi:hypothetical protein C9374_006923 [Naegleria lovaniensis]|uniref:Intraflagellar transport protein 43 n=1 Tax=Naegleria lovaniensis TaxID=51637 RepID=A0AA88H5Z7_NAELO|nr:uncharacterized protein C9374_006923 [Naegleria lovaniensis]KAG2393392.1 hypothetical protein C9374_006923 [Naegleria lovaniensis]